MIFYISLKERTKEKERKREKVTELFIFVQLGSDEYFVPSMLLLDKKHALLSANDIETMHKRSLDARLSIGAGMCVREFVLPFRSSSMFVQLAPLLVEYVGMDTYAR